MTAEIAMDFRQIVFCNEKIRTGEVYEQNFEESPDNNIDYRRNIGIGLYFNDDEDEARNA
jgi:hypothetical protein